MKRQITVALFLALFMAIAGPVRGGGATTVVSVSAFAPTSIVPGQTAAIDIAFHADLPVEALSAELVDMFGQPVIAPAQAAIISFAQTCGTETLFSPDKISLNDQGCPRGQSGGEEHVFLQVQCYTQAKYSLVVTAAHLPAQSSQSFICTTNPLHKGLVPTISADVIGWLKLLLRRIERPAPPING